MKVGYFIIFSQDFIVAHFHMHEGYFLHLIVEAWSVHFVSILSLFSKFGPYSDEFTLVRISEELKCWNKIFLSIGSILGPKYLLELSDIFTV